MQKRVSSDSTAILTLEGSIDQELNFDLRAILSEECGLAAAINLPLASRYVYDCLMLQEHRGQDSVGIISFDGANVYTRRRMGRVREQFVDVAFESELPGHTAVGHNRYATHGSADEIANIQPLFFPDTRYGPLAIAHNGGLFDRHSTRAALIQEGVLFQSSMDSEIFGHLIARSSCAFLEDAIIQATQQIPASYSLLIFCQKKVIALRDPYGVRPLSMGKIESGYLVCSENYTFDQYPSCESIGDIQPGEMVIFEHGSSDIQRISYRPPQEHFCIFEGIYFSDPRSRYREFWHEDFRHELGKQILRENPDLDGDCIVPVLDSGKHAALGLAQASGIPYHEYFKRLHNPPRANIRSFITAKEEERIHTAYQKLHLRREKIQGKRIIVVDDSIVRSTTIRLINQRLREAGAVFIVNCISAPPIVSTCPYGMDFQRKTELIAHRHSIEEIRLQVGADRLIYLSREGLHRVVQDTYRCGICSGCFGGSYAANYGIQESR